MNVNVVTKDEIRTERLALRPYCENDRARIKALLREEKIARTFIVPDLSDEAEADRLADRIIAVSSPDRTDRLAYGIFLGEKLIGFINDCGIEEDGIELGYAIDPAEWGKGYATETLAAVLNELGEMGFHRVCAAYFEENPASRRVMEKCGLGDMDLVTEIDYRGITHKCHYLGIILGESQKH